TTEQSSRISRLASGFGGGSGWYCPQVPVHSPVTSGLGAVLESLPSCAPNESATVARRTVAQTLEKPGHLRLRFDEPRMSRFSAPRHRTHQPLEPVASSEKCPFPSRTASSLATSTR